MASRRKLFERAKHFTGLDRAIVFTLSSRAIQIFSSVGTALLILRFLSPTEQGYYYTLLSLAALQTVFELGFSFVILQLAAHETAYLTIRADGGIEGDARAHARLASVLQLTVRWYARAAILMALVLLPLGVVFFSRSGRGAAPVAWLGPWVATVIAVSAGFALTPLYSFLEGCNQVRQVALLRMFQALVVLVLSWSAIASHHGLYACALVNAGSIAAGAVFLARQRIFLAGLLRRRAREFAISWRKEIWPFQWKIAATWLCSYFTIQIFTPILFACRGPQEAGRMGFSLSIVGYLPFLALGWITTKATPFGQLIRQGRFAELDSLFFRTLKQSLTSMLMLAGLCLAAVLAAQHLAPAIARRMEPPRIFAFLLFAAVGSFVVQSLAVYLRSFQREPYLTQSIVVSVITLTATLRLAPRWGSTGVALVYFTCSGLLGLIWAIQIFYAQKRSRLSGDVFAFRPFAPSLTSSAGTIGEGAIEREAQ
jgi:hypothetical protein